MKNWYNSEGNPLSAESWLAAHHQAKRPEREAFVNKLCTEFSPRKIVDIGCGTGLWLDIFSARVGENCELIGIEKDLNSLELAIKRSSKWPCKSKFINLDIELDTDLPEADLYLAFNIFPYLNNPLATIDKIRTALSPGGTLVIRQYDGGMLRIGPLSESAREIIDSSLRTSVSNSSQFYHYDLDRVFRTSSQSLFKKKNFEFEVFFRKTPFPEEFKEYFFNTTNWMLGLISDRARICLNKWTEEFANHGAQGGYFMEVDLIIFMS